MIAQLTRRVFLSRIAAMMLASLILSLALGTALLRPATQAHASVSGFVTRSGSQLYLNGQQFRFSGANMYWLTLDENVGGVNYPTPFRVDDGFATAQEMGATVVRSGADAIGCSLCLEPSLGTFNSTAFQHLDYAIKSAQNHGIRLILDLVDNYHYYGGGKHTFTDWIGDSNEDDFYTNATAISDFEQYISTVLNHVNTYTGVAYKNDPTILAWEEGNELSDAPDSWISTIGTYIKSIDPNHLISFSSSDNGTPATVQQDTLSISTIDMEDAHFYPMSVSTLNNDASTTEQAGKVFYAGEYDWDNYPVSWQNNATGDSLSSFLSAIETDGTAGDTYWSLFPHNDAYGYVQHGDGYTLHYPGDTSDMQSRDQALRTHAYTMSGLAVPTNGIPDAPLITSVSGQAIAWRGSTPSVTYSVERSTSGNNGPWTVICNQCATDNSTPWTDSSQPTSGTIWYRVRGYNLSGVPGGYSPVYQYNATSNVVQNPGFESGNLSGWSVWNGSNGSGAGAAYAQAGTPHSGTYNGVEWKSSSYEVSLYQCVSNIPNGTYVASAWVESSGGQNAANFELDNGNHSNILASLNIPTSQTWQLLPLPAVVITTGEACLTFYSNSPGNDWIAFDDISLMNVPTNLAQNPGFETGDLTDWNVWAPGGQCTCTAGVESQPASYSGIYNMDQYDSTSAFQVSVYQAIPNIPNGTYTLSGWIEGSGQSVMQIRDQPGGNVLSQTSISSYYPNWTQFSTTATITGGQADIEFDTNGSAGNFLRVDDVSFTSV